MVPLPARRTEENDLGSLFVGYFVRARVRHYICNGAIAQHHPERDRSSAAVTDAIRATGGQGGQLQSGWHMRSGLHDLLGVVFEEYGW